MKIFCFALLILSFGSVIFASIEIPENFEVKSEDDAPEHVNAEDDTLQNYPSYDFFRDTVWSNPKENLDASNVNYDFDPYRKGDDSSKENRELEQNIDDYFSSDYFNNLENGIDFNFDSDIVKDDSINSDCCGDTESKDSGDLIIESELVGEYSNGDTESKDSGDLIIESELEGEYSNGDTNSKDSSDFVNEDNEVIVEPKLQGESSFSVSEVPQLVILSVSEKPILDSVNLEHKEMLEDSRNVEEENIHATEEDKPKEKIPFQEKSALYPNYEYIYYSGADYNIKGDGETNSRVIGGKRGNSEIKNSYDTSYFDYFYQNNQYHFGGLNKNGKENSIQDVIQQPDTNYDAKSDESILRLYKILNENEDENKKDAFFNDGESQLRIIAFAKESIVYVPKNSDTSYLTPVREQNYYFTETGVPPSPRKRFILLMGPLLIGMGIVCLILICKMMKGKRARKICVRPTEVPYQPVVNEV